MDLFADDLNNDGIDDFVLTSLNIKERNSPSPIAVFLSQANAPYIVSRITGPFHLFHARHVSFSDLNGDGFKEILVADHGPDIEPFPGGKSVLLENVSGQEFKSHYIPSPPKFTFNISPVSLGGQKRLLLNSISNGKGPGLQLLDVSLENNLNVIDQSHLLPQDALKSCYMTSVAGDIFQGGNEELVLGGCDRPAVTLAADQDLILEWDQTLSSPRTTTLARRHMDPKWGSVAWEIGDVNQDELPDLVRSTHDFGFRNAQVDVFLQTPKKGLKKLDSFFDMPVQNVGFVPWIYSASGFLYFNLVIVDYKKEYDGIQKSFVYQYDGVDMVDRSECLPKEVLQGYRKFLIRQGRLYLYNQEGIFKVPSGQIRANTASPSR